MEDNNNPIRPSEEEIERAMTGQPAPARPNLGMAQSYSPGADNRVHIDDLQANMVGWKPMPLELLPSGGRFYPDGTVVEIRSADVKEIRYYSTLDENDPISIEERMEKILSMSCRVRLAGGPGSHKDLKSEDRFYVVFAIREITFINGEGKIMQTVTCDAKCSGDGSWSEKFELTKDAFEFYTIDERIMQKFDNATKSFVIDHPKVGRLQLFVPSSGVSSEVVKYTRNMVREGKKFDEGAVKLLPFVIPDWRGLTDEKIRAHEIDVASWGKDKFSAAKLLSEMIKFGAKTYITRRCADCGREVTAPINFPGGIRSLFVVSDILDEIL